MVSVSKSPFVVALLVVVATVCLEVTITSAAPVPILEYTFNETGTTAASSGSDSTAVTLRNSVGTATDMHSTAGAGVSGGPGDRAFDNTSASMGTTGGWADQADNAAIDALQSVTLVTWYKPTVALNTVGARLMSNFGASKGFDLNNGSTNAWTMYADSNFSSTSNGVFGALDPGNWIFVAASYDAVASGGTIKFYRGTASGAVTLLNTVTGVGSGTLEDDSVGLVIGNFSDPINTARAFQGLIDDTRIYGSTTNASGALTLSDLESLRQNDLVPVLAPEPSTAAIVGAIGAMLGIRRRRHSA